MAVRRLFALLFLLPCLCTGAFPERPVEMETFGTSVQATHCKDIREVDFRNRTYAIDDLGMGSVELKDGKWEFSPQVINMDEWAALAQVLYCGESAFVTVSWCISGGSTTCKATTIQFLLFQSDLWRVAQVTYFAQPADVPDPEVNCEAKTLTIYLADKWKWRDDGKMVRNVFQFVPGFAGEMELVSSDEIAHK